MGRETGISWTDSTWNPIRGCSRVSEGCRNCYAETVANRFCGPGSPYEGVVQIGENGKGLGKWNGQIKFVEKHLLDPLRWKKPCRIFVNSMSDLFHENVTDEMLDRIFAVMALSPQHTFQVLTKRPERMLAYLSASYRKTAIWMMMGCFDKGLGMPCPTWPLSNVWLGTSVENQKTADERIPLLLQTPAAVRFISAEPLLGPVDLRMIEPEGLELPLALTQAAVNVLEDDEDRFFQAPATLDWVIVGGESGHGARPMHPDWARSLCDQCGAAGVPFFFKQWGEYKQATEVVEGFSRSTGNFETVPASNVFLRVGTKAAGCLLDGVEHHEFPAVER